MIGRTNKSDKKEGIRPGLDLLNRLKKQEDKRNTLPYVPLTSPPSVKAKSLNFHRSTSGCNNTRLISSAFSCNFWFLDEVPESEGVGAVVVAVAGALLLVLLLVLLVLWLVVVALLLLLKGVVVFNVEATVPVVGRAGVVGGSGGGGIGGGGGCVIVLRPIVSFAHKNDSTRGGVGI